MGVAFNYKKNCVICQTEFETNFSKKYIVVENVILIQNQYLQQKEKIMSNQQKQNVKLLMKRPLILSKNI